MNKGYPRRTSSPKIAPISLKGKQVGIIVSRFNEFITKELLKACLNRLGLYGIKEREVTVIWVPGSLELPLAALQLAKKKSIKAVICLGAVIRGETYHFEVVAKNTAKGIMDVALMTGKPCIFGVLTTNTIKQAYRRCEKKGINKGGDAADAAINMVKALEIIRKIRE